MINVYINIYLKDLSTLLFSTIWDVSGGSSRDTKIHTNLASPTGRDRELNDCL